MGINCELCREGVLRLRCFLLPPVPLQHCHRSKVSCLHMQCEGERREGGEGGREGGREEGRKERKEGKEGGRRKGGE